MTTRNNNSSRFTRRQLLTAIPGLAILAAGVACGDDDNNNAGGTPTATAESTPGGAGNATPTTTGESAFPVTIEHELGSTTVESAPTRIVAAGFNEADFLLAFGIVPVGVRDFVGEFPEETRPWAADLIGDAAPVDIGGMEIDFEQVAQLEPDAILAVYAFLDENSYGLLSGIAPTVTAPAGGATWQEQTMITGRVLGQEERAAEIVAEIDQRFADVAAEHPEFQEKTLALLWGVGEPGEGYTLLEPSDLRAQIFYNMGFTPPETTGSISNEQAALIDQDVIAVFGWTEEDLAEDELFQGLSAVQAGRVVYVGGWETEMAGALGFGSPLSIPYAIELAAPLLAEAIQAG